MDLDQLKAFMADNDRENVNQELLNVLEALCEKVFDKVVKKGRKKK